MTKFKRTIASLLCAVMILGSTPIGALVGLDFSSLFEIKASASTYYGECGEDLTWLLDTETGTLEIAGSGKMTDWPEYCDVPWYWHNSYIKSVVIYDFEDVTSIGECAFFACKNLTSVTIPDTVTSIGDWAFAHCTALARIEIPASVTSLGDNVFAYCDALISIKIPNSVKSIGEEAFNECESLESVTLGSSVEHIGLIPFYNCAKLETINIPDGVKHIGRIAFYGCSALETITLPDSIENIEAGAFEYSGLADASYINNHLIKGDGSAIREGTISIAGGAFASDEYVTITIPASVKGIGKAAFLSCPKLESISVHKDNKNYTSDNGILFSKDKTQLIRCPEKLQATSVTIPASVTHIADYAFDYCKNLTSVTIPDSVTYIGDYAFRCPYGSLTSIDLPDSLTYLGDYAFESCEKITAVDIPDSLKNIGDYAFNGCSSLADVSIGSSVETIGEYAFRNCSLTNLIIPDSVKDIGARAFDYNNLETVIIGNGVEYIHDNAFRWGNEIKSITLPCTASISSIAFSECEKVILTKGSGKEVGCNLESLSPKELVIQEGVTFIGQLSYNGLGRITSVTIPSTVKEIADGAFRYCYALKNITIPDSVESIGASVFYSCSSLKNITIPDSVESIGASVFYSCSSLESIIIPNKVTCIEESTFNDCTALNSVTIPDSVTSIGYSAFKNCTALESVTVPKNVTSIGGEAFKGCTALTSITIPESVTSINSNAFYNTGYYNDESNWENGVLYINKALIIANGSLSGEYKIKDGTSVIATYVFEDCNSLTSITIPDSVKNMGTGTFNNCTALESATLSNSLTSIPYSAFGGCTSLKSITIPKNVTSIGSEAFRSCIALESVTIPKSVANIYGYAFNNCTSLTDIYYEGTEEEWKAITVSSYGNDVLSTAKIHYNSGACDHSYTSVITKQPTCSEMGIRTYTCSKCSNSYTENIAKKAHTPGTWQNEKSATCTEKGSEVKKCTVCKETVETRETAELGHNYKSSITDATCKAPGKMVYTCSLCQNSYEEIIPQKEHKLKKVTVEATCTEKGSEYNKCELCGDTIGEVTTIPAKGHTEGEWETVLKPTIDADGKKVKKCTVCKEVVKEEAIEKLASSKDETTGVELGFDKENYNGKIEIVVEEEIGGTVSEIVNTQTGAVKSQVFDITMTMDGEEIQPNGNVVVRIPLPENYDPKRTFVCFIDAVKNTIETIESECVNGYFVFETDHFSYYSLVELGEAKLTMTAPAKADYKTEATVSVSAENLPENAKITWSASGAKVNLTPSADGKSCKVTFLEKGDVTIKATTSDMNGKEVTESTKISVKYTWWQWILIILLFGWIWY